MRWWSERGYEMWLMSYSRGKPFDTRNKSIKYRFFKPRTLTFIVALCNYFLLLIWDFRSYNLEEIKKIFKRFSWKAGIHMRSNIALIYFVHFQLQLQKSRIYYKSLWFYSTARFWLKNSSTRNLPPLSNRCIDIFGLVSIFSTKFWVLT